MVQKIMLRNCSDVPYFSPDFRQDISFTVCEASTKHKLTAVADILKINKSESYRLPQVL